MCFNTPTRRNAARRHQAFTFIEVMVVVVIIGLLAGAVAIKVSDYVDKAKLNRAKSDIATIVNAVESYYADRGQYPSNEDGLGVLPIKSATDPWNRPYQYNNPGRNEPYEVICYGADGREGGEGPNTDITSENLTESHGS
ncbi:prepilin-type N-terminal cleavage/methylation domain-containing protein [Planctomycetales bacterium ZRK34]|nr:prepilin-type N-terminal cleavage/methylation domain-containing protein [Planctomycetales bacterium ZRK34]